ncbi:rab-GTPase-TBC domain-containing protein [Gigaspora rosea]|uniref:Rab-GTPase-TBC domain-containing protein n=1 Tax=Gigaspora rosea TaxID=44941 RepID=A0A397UUQ0_9GLOM|nr:rab-GTPase-TBC domain-containing protein [Gigaspora rosea]
MPSKKTTSEENISQQVITGSDRNESLTSKDADTSKLSSSAGQIVEKNVSITNNINDAINSDKDKNITIGQDTRNKIRSNEEKSSGKTASRSKSSVIKSNSTSANTKQANSTKEKQKPSPIITAIRAKSESDKKKATSTPKIKNVKKQNKEDILDDDSSENDLSLNKKRSVPPKLNLTFKNRPIDPPKQSPLRSTITSDSLAQSPIISPKIMELRRSESFASKTINNTDEDTPSVTTNPKKKTTKQPTFSAKVRRGSTVRTQAKKTTSALGVLPKGELNQEILARLEEQNSQLPPQFFTEFLLARLERQNEMLDNDPKSVCIKSNVLQANLETVQSLINHNTNLSVNDNSDEIIPVFKNEDLSDIVDLDFWTALIQDYTSVAAKLPHLLAAKLQQGLPPKLRGILWQSMSQASSTYLETMYSQLLSESSPYDKIIQRDLARTFPSIEMFKEENGEGQTMLWNVLRAYSLYDPLVGYCQGLGFLVGPLLMNMNEVQAFCVFVRLMETYDMRTMFTLNMEGLQLRHYQFTALLSQILPDLHAHFLEFGVNVAMFASQWFLSLFAYTYPLPLVLRIYDIVFAEGAPETIMRVAVALLQKNEAKLLALEEFEDLLDYLTTSLYESYNNEPTGLIHDAMALSSVITKAKLDQLSDVYVKELEDKKKRADELVAVRFNGRFGRNKKEKKCREKRDKPKRWSFGSLPSSKDSKDSSSTSSDLSTSDNESQVQTSTSSLASTNVGILHQQIEDLVTALSHLQKEHADMTDQLVKIKMEKMDFVTEVETLKLKLRGLEKENKRMSTDSIYSIESSTTLNDENSYSGRTTRISSPVTPTLSKNELFIKQNEILKSKISQTEHLSDSTYTEQKSNLNNDWTNEFKKGFIMNETTMIEELERVKEEKYELLQENIELVKRVDELEVALENSTLTQSQLLDKNIFLREEIERLDEEATQALYEQSTMENDVKEVKNLRSENAKLITENERIKKELEILRQGGTTTNSNEIGEIREIREIREITNKSASSRRVSFLSFFSTDTNPKYNSKRRNTDPFSDFQPSECIGECAAKKRAENSEQMLSQVKSLLEQSEAAREAMSVQLEELNNLINGFSDITDLVPFEPEEIEIDSKSKRGKRFSTLSLASFFGNAS